MRVAVALRATNEAQQHQRLIDELHGISASAQRMPVPAAQFVVRDDFEHLARVQPVDGDRLSQQRIERGDPAQDIGAGFTPALVEVAVNPAARAEQGSRPTQDRLDLRLYELRWEAQDVLTDKGSARNVQRYSS